MIETKAALGVLDLLYETLDDSGKWKDWLDETCNVLRVDGGNITYASVTHPERSLILANHITAEQHDSYVQNYIEMDWLRQLIMDKPVGATSALSDYSEQIISDYIESEFFQEFAKDTCLWMSMGGWFKQSPDWLGNTGFHRGSMDAPFSGEETEFLEHLHPHISRVLQQADYVNLLEEAVSHLGPRTEAVFLIGADGAVQYANDAASNVVNAGGLNVRNQQLLADTPADTARLQAAIAPLLVPQEEGFELGTDLFLPRANNPVPLVVSVTPNYRKTPFHQAGTSPIRAVVTVTDPKHQPELRRRILTTLYGFTRREIEIGECLATGQALPAIADVLGTSYHTVRSQVKGMIQKTGVRGQNQLMAFLACFSD